MYLNALKDNPYMDRACCTGITLITEEEIFSKLNHYTLNSMNTKRISFVNECFGYTEKEVKQLICKMLTSQDYDQNMRFTDEAKNEIQFYFDRIKKWCNGYNIGGQ